MSLTRRTLAWAPLLAVLTALAAAPKTARAQATRGGAQGDSATRAALVSERQRVRGELERANADVDALKRSGRGLREDYRLRERLADAEALARRLTELDAHLGRGAASASVSAGTEPSVSPADGPAELEAKADILADQAQRLTARGDALLGRARDLRARQTLRRRVGQMERDPFSPLEGSKRRASTGAVASAAVPASPPSRGATQTASGGNGSDKGVGGGVTTSPPGAGDSVPVVAINPSPGAAIPAGALGGTPTSPPGGQAVASPTTSPTPTSAAAATSDGAALSVQLRELLDPTTLAELQHLEASGGASTSLETLERAGAALKARAERLREQSAQLRSREHAPARTR